MQRHQKSCKSIIIKIEKHTLPAVFNDSDLIRLTSLQKDSMNRCKIKHGNFSRKQILIKMKKKIDKTKRILFFNLW